MKIVKDELLKVLSQFNPWWRGEGVPDLAPWQRACFRELFNWVYTPPAPRAVLLSGARQVGKTTLLLQVVNKLLEEGVAPANILYVTFDHPIIKMSDMDTILEAWREHEPIMQGIEYLFLDEAQFVRDWGTWVKHQVDFIKDRRIIFTGSAMPLICSSQESGVGRWHTIKLTTLSFYEYLQLKEAQQLDFFSLLNLKLDDKLKTHSWLATELSKLKHKTFSLPKIPSLKSLQDLFEWPQQKFYEITQLSSGYIGHFHEYLVRGGFPQTARVNSISQAQRLLREDIIEKVLKRDMTALFGVRRVLDLEQTFVYLCMHDGGLLDMTDLCANLEVKRPTVQNYIELLEASHLIYRLQPFGYGKDILRAKFKIYLADAAIAPAVLLKGKSLIEDPTGLGIATETAVFKHLFAHYHLQGVRLTYWRGNKNHEVDIVAEKDRQIIPFEVKYRTQHTKLKELTGLLELCQKKSVEYAYIVTKSISDFGLLNIKELDKTRIMRVPAPLLCYWLGETELMGLDTSMD
jgi:predicted AAA+ superfamily ATPase